MKYQRIILLAAIVCFPALTLTVKKSNSVIFYLLLLTGIAAIFVTNKDARHSFRKVFSAYWPLHLAMGALALAVLPHQILAGHFEFNPYDIPLRIACFPILFFSFLSLKSSDLKTLHWGLILGTFINLVAIYFATSGGDLRPAKVHFLGIIPFSNFAMLMAFLALLSVGWQHVKSPGLTGIKVATVAIGLLITFLSQSRGGWFALPIYLIVAGALFLPHHRKATVVVLCLATTCILGTAIFSKSVQTRARDIWTDVISYSNKSNPDTSVGLRLQFWTSATVIIRENPLAGIGPDGYRSKMAELARRGLVTPTAATYPHCHNELLFETVRYGVFGLLALLAAMLAPLYYFGRNLRHADRQARTTAWMGCTFGVAIITFGLTDVVLVWRETATFYVFFVAFLLAMLVRQKQEYGIG